MTCSCLVHDHDRKFTAVFGPGRSTNTRPDLPAVTVLRYRFVQGRPTERAYHDLDERVFFLDDHETPEGSDETRALLEALDPASPDIDAVRALLRCDLDRLRTWLESRPEGEFEGVYAMDGSVDRLGAGVIVRARVDMRHFVCALDSEYQTLNRLGAAQVIDGQHGLTLDAY